MIVIGINRRGITENLCGEDAHIHVGALLYRRRQPGFSGDLRKKRLPIPAMLGRDLREEETAAPAIFNQEPVFSDFNFIHPLDADHFGENRYLDPNSFQLILFQSVESHVFEGRLRGDFLYSFNE